MIILISSITYDFSLLQYWVTYYLGLGVDQVILEVPHENRSLYASVQSVCESRRWPVKLITGAPCMKGDPKRYIEHLESNKEYLRRRFISKDDWVVPADLDEFIEFPRQIKILVQLLEDEQLDFLGGTLVDRIASNGCLPSIDVSKSLWEQFPLECNITGALAKGRRSKVVLCRGSCEIGKGHHRIRNSRGSGSYKVHHFKWRRGIIETLIARVKLCELSKRYNYAKESRAIIEYFEKHACFIPEDFRATVGWSPDRVGIKSAE
jgi:hypothetical protein